MERKLAAILAADAVGFSERRARFERYATWTDEDLREFHSVLDAQRVIDAELWS